MQIVLLERIAKLGQMGDVVTVKDGYARNYLLPQGKALRANKDSLARFEKERAQFEARNLESKKQAEGLAKKLDGRDLIIIRQSSESGQLYGSVNSRDIAEALSGDGVSLTRNQIVLARPIKALGLHEVHVVLHPEVETKITVNVARTEEEAARQRAGEDVTASPEEGEATKSNVEDMFDQGVEVTLDDAAPEEVAEETEAEDTPEDGAENEGA